MMARTHSIVERVVDSLKRSRNPRSSADLAREFLGVGVIDEARAKALLAPTLSQDPRLRVGERGWSLQERADAPSPTLDPPLESAFVALFAPREPAAAAACSGNGTTALLTVCAQGRAEADRFERRHGSRVPPLVVDLRTILRRWRGWQGPADPASLAAAAGCRHVVTDTPEGMAATVATTWGHLAQELAAEGIERWSELEILLGDRLEPADFEGKAFGPADMVSLPAAPGVYSFLDEDGHTLYVGQSGCLVARVASYFRGMPRDEKDREIRRRSFQLRTRAVECGPDAALLEAEWIANMAPSLNVRVTTRPGEPDEGILLAPRFTPGKSGRARGWIAFTLADGALRRRGGLLPGPLRAPRGAQSAVDALVSRAESGCDGSAATLLDRWRRAHPEAPFLRLAVDGGPEDLVTQLVQLAHAGPT